MLWLVQGTNFSFIYFENLLVLFFLCFSSYLPTSHLTPSSRPSPVSPQHGWTWQVCVPSLSLHVTFSLLVFQSTLRSKCRHGRLVCWLGSEVSWALSSMYRSWEYLPGSHGRCTCVRDRRRPQRRSLRRPPCWPRPAWGARGSCRPCRWERRSDRGTGLFVCSNDLAGARPCICLREVAEEGCLASIVHAVHDNGWGLLPLVRGIPLSHLFCRYKNFWGYTMGVGRVGYFERQKEGRRKGRERKKVGRPNTPQSCL